MTFNFFFFINLKKSYYVKKFNLVYLIKNKPFFKVKLLFLIKVGILNNFLLNLIFFDPYE